MGYKSTLQMIKNKIYIYIYICVYVPYMYKTEKEEKNMEKGFKNKRGQYATEMKRKYLF